MNADGAMENITESGPEQTETTSLAPDRSAHWIRRLHRYDQRIKNVPPLVVEGTLQRSVGLTLEAVGCQAAVGGRCRIISPDQRSVEAEVVGFAGERLYLMPTGPMHGQMPNARVVPIRGVADAPVGPELLGRVLDGAGRPLDGRGLLHCVQRMPLTGAPINPLSRQSIREPLDVGVRAINALLTVGRGQRMGLFAGSGVGKSMLLGMMTRYTEADVIVVGLIGERGREVQDFVSRTLGEEGIGRAVVVATPADDPPLMRLQGAWLATTVAEYFRDQGLKVLLLMDSLTRVAQAQREVGLAIGEPPATKGYPPSVFAKIPQLVERAGNDANGHGSITAFYTVLTEGDDHNDPIADAARAILDGHVVLSRRLAESGHFPAIDIEASVSRAITDMAEPAHLEKVRRFRRIYSTYQQNRDLISVGAYQAGSDRTIDEAILQFPVMSAFLQQDVHEAVSFRESLEGLQTLLAPLSAASSSVGSDA